MVRIFRHYIPASYLVLWAIEWLVVYISVKIGIELRFGIHGGDIESIDRVVEKSSVVAFSITLSMTAMGLYLRNLRQAFPESVVRINISIIISILALSLIYYLYPEMTLGRGILAYSLLISAILLNISRYLFYLIIDTRTIGRRVLVFGAGENASTICNYLRRKRDRVGFEIAGYIDPEAGSAAAVDQIISFDEPLLNICRKNHIDEIVVALDDRRNTLPIDELLHCKVHGIDVLELNTFFERTARKIIIKTISPSWFVFSDGFKTGWFRVYLKRFIDLLSSILLMIVSLPVLIIVAIAIYIEDRGPIFYRQVRIGQDNKPFSIVKFRSMQREAEADGEVRFAQINDNRITRVGRIIRKLRIDEIPQIINVLKGEMSFVGPRPERPELVEEYSRQIRYYNERHLVKPGITGWAQINYPYGDSLKDTIEKLQYDLYYVKNYSLFLDLVIIIQTLGSVLWGNRGR